jgi:hypothetical protein
LVWKVTAVFGLVGREVEAFEVLIGRVIEAFEGLVTARVVKVFEEE